MSNVAKACVRSRCESNQARVVSSVCARLLVDPRYKVLVAHMRGVNIYTHSVSPENSGIESELIVLTGFVLGIANRK